MTIENGSQYLLTDGLGALLGRVAVIETYPSGFCGTFEKYSQFSTYEPLFKEHEQCVNDQRFLASSKLETQIFEIGARLCSLDRSLSIQIYDLQIMNENDICFRIIELPPISGHL